MSRIPGAARLVQVDRRGPVASILVALALTVRSSWADYPRYAPPGPPTARFAVSAIDVVVSADARVRRSESRSRAASEKGQEAVREWTEDWELDGYADLLRKVVKPWSGRGSQKITLRVHVANVSLADLERDWTSATVSVVATDEKGRELASTSGATTLIGSAYHTIDAAVVDAFQRSTVSDAFIGRVNEALACGECPAAAPMPRSVNAWAVSGEEQTAAAHVVALTFDAGRAYSLGARYLHQHLGSGTGLGWAGYGVEARGFSANAESVDGGAVYGVLHGGAGAGQAFSAEAAVGVGSRPGGVRGLASFGIFFTLYYVDLGFTYQASFAPSDRPEWLPGPAFGVRINVPVDVHWKHVECHSPSPPCRWTGILPMTWDQDPAVAKQRPVSASAGDR